MMINLYVKQRDDQQRRANDFLHKYAFFAFSEEQFDAGMKKLGLAEGDEKHLFRIQGGGYLLASHARDFTKMLNDFAEERKAALNDPQTGRKFAYDMFFYELANHEYSYTGDADETLEALGYTAEDVEADPMLKEALMEAKKKAGGL